MSDKPDVAKLLGATEAPTFLGVPHCDDLDALDASSVFIGVPGATAYGTMGAFCRNAPKALRTSISYETPLVDRHNFDIDGPIFPRGCKRAVDCGDLAWNGSDYASNRALIRATVAKVVASGAIPIVVGGDDSVPIPMLDALADSGEEYSVLQIDAHIDWRDSHMGEAFGLSSNMRRASEMSHIKQIVQVGMRGFGSGHSDDYQNALDWGVRFFPANQIHRHGIQQALECINDGANIIICVDVDGLDPSVVPGVIARTPGGLSYTQVMDLILGAAKKGRIAAIDFAEFLPEADIDGLGALAVSRLIAASMGILARQQMLT
mgnify:CR=1 FL=1